MRESSDSRISMLMSGAIRVAQDIIVYASPKKNSIAIV
jgi:hypothetical protein